MVVTRFSHTFRHCAIFKFKRHYQILGRSNTRPVMIAVRTMLQWNLVLFSTAQVTKWMYPNLFLVVCNDDFVPFVGSFSIDTACTIQQFIVTTVDNFYSSFTGSTVSSSTVTVELVASKRIHGTVCKQRAGNVQKDTSFQCSSSTFGGSTQVSVRYGSRQILFRYFAVLNNEFQTLFHRTTRQCHLLDFFLIHCF